MPKIMKADKELTSQTLNAEILLNENTRKSNEESRVTNETTRQSNESTRQTKETSRVSAESSRVNAETSRVSAEATRQSNETSRQTFYNAYKIFKNWDSTTAWKIGNHVYHNRSTYQALTDNTNHEPPEDGDTTWMLISKHGEDGIGGDMMASVYDPDGKATNIFSYIDQVVSQLSNGNLLINADFQIWQRGESFRPVVNGGSYTVDRWKSYMENSSNLNIYKNSSGNLVIQRVSLSYAGSIYQPIERIIPAGQVLTLSAKIDGVIGSVSGVLSSNFISTLISNVNIGFFLGGTWGFEVSINPNDTSEHIIEWVKLEYGSIATPFAPRTYAEELAMCQRYYERSESWISSIAVNSTEICGFPFNVCKRIVPTISITSQNSIVNSISLWGVTLTRQVTGVQASTSNVLVIGSSDVVAGSHYTYLWTADAEI